MAVQKIIDLTMPCADGMDGFRVSLQKDLPVYLGHECYAYDLQIRSHRGTYFETSSHLFRDGLNTDDVPLERLVLPGFCVRVSEKDRMVTAADLESAGVPPEPGYALLIDTGNDRTKYFSRDSAQWMACHKIALMGSDTRSYDSGFENPTGFFVDLFKADIPIIANLVNVDQLPSQGFTLIVLPLRVANVCTVPCRVIAVLGPLK